MFQNEVEGVVNANCNCNNSDITYIDYWVYGDVASGEKMKTWEYTDYEKEVLERLSQIVALLEKIDAKIPEPRSKTDASDFDGYY